MRFSFTFHRNFIEISLKVGTQFTMKVPLAGHRFNSTNLYFTIVAPGVYDIHSSVPIDMQDIKFLLTVQIEGNG